MQRTSAQVQRPEPVRPFIVPKKKIEPQELLVRLGVVQLLAHQQRKPVDIVMREVYGDDEALKAVSSGPRRLRPHRQPPRLSAGPPSWCSR